MSTDLRATRELAPPPAAPTNADLPLFRFGLRQLLVFVSLMSLLMAAMAAMQAMTAIVLLMATLIVVFHLFSTALGSQLRGHADHARNHEGPPCVPRTINGLMTTHAQSAAARPPATRSPWHQRCTPLPWLPRFVGAAFLIGGAVGGVLLSGTIGHRTSPAGIAVGSFSLAVIAGWLAFVSYSFYGVFRHGLRDAVAQDQRDHSR